MTQSTDPPTAPGADPTDGAEGKARLPDRATPRRRDVRMTFPVRVTTAQASRIQ